LVVSGLALGTDGCAHTEALKNNISTVGVLAHGLHILYPSQHKKLSQEMIEKEALLSPNLISNKPDREHFLQRNRVVAGFSGVNCCRNSLWRFYEYRKLCQSIQQRVFALPGKITDKYSQGCNLLSLKTKPK
jgi:DNA processing protein